MTSKKRIKYWVLKDGRNYFREWTGIGPRATQNRSEAEQFKTEHDAMQSPAYSFALTFYKPTAIR